MTRLSLWLSLGCEERQTARDIASLSHFVMDCTIMTSIAYNLAVEVSDGKDERLAITNRITVNMSKRAPLLPP